MLFIENIVFASVIAQVEIVDMEVEKIKAIEEMREKMVQATNEAALTVMGLNNELNELEVMTKTYYIIHIRQKIFLQLCYASSKADTIKWSRVLISTKRCIAEKEMISFRLLDQIQQVYRLFCARKNAEPVLRREQIEEQLDYVKGEMEFLANLLALVNRTKFVDEKYGKKTGNDI